MNMRSATVMLLTTFTLLGCGKKPMSRDAVPGTPPPPPTTKPTAHVSSFGNKPVIPNQAGNLTVNGGGIFAPLKATARVANEAQLRDLHLSMTQTWLGENRLPGVEEIKKEARQNPQLLPLLEGEVIILTGTKSGDAVWAYTQYPQRANEHYVVISSGVVQMPPEELRKRLEAEKAPIKMSN